MSLVQRVFHVGVLACVEAGDEGSLLHSIGHVELGRLEGIRSSRHNGHLYPVQIV